jgi:hypothetical protein
VNIDYHIEFDGHFYSAPYTLVRQEVRVRATESLVAIYHNGKQVTVHPRSQAKGRFSTRSEHMPPNHQFIAGIGPDWLLKEAEKNRPADKSLLLRLAEGAPVPAACLSRLPGHSRSGSAVSASTNGDRLPGLVDRQSTFLSTV